MQNKHQSIKSESGQGFLEYGILIFVLIISVITTIIAMGEETGGLTQRVADGLRGEGKPTSTPEQPILTDVRVSVLDGSENGIEGVPVSVFDGEGNYTGDQVETDGEGVALFEEFDSGKYAFRADHQQNSFWSEEIVLPDQTSTVIHTGQGPIKISVTDSIGNPLDEISVSAFTSTDQYIGVSGTTSGGLVVLEVAEGFYKFRAQYQGEVFWSDIIQYPEVTELTIKINLIPYSVRVATRDGKPASDVPVYAYTADGQYTGISAVTDQTGNATLDIKEGTYQFRADYGGKMYWTPEISAPPSSSTEIEVGPYQVVVQVIDRTGTGIAGVPVYVYNQQRQYLGKSGTTDSQGEVEFDLLEGSYQFRVDYARSVIWSDNINVPSSLRTTVDVGERIIAVLLERPNGKPLPNTYVFIYSYQTRSYRYWRRTDQQGFAYFVLPPGRYLALGYQFRPRYNYEWSDPFNIPGTSQVTIIMR